MPHDPKTIKSHEADPNVFTKTVTETFRVEHAHSPAALSLHSSLGYAPVQEVQLETNLKGMKG